MLTNLITTIACSALGVVLLNAFFELFNWYPLPSYYLALSSEGLMHGYLWQPLTHLFLLGADTATFFSLFWFALLLYMLWMFGTQVAGRIGERQFLVFFFTIGILSGLITALTTGAIISGCFASVLAVFAGWVLLNPEEEVLFFFLIPAKAKWLLAGILGASILIAISQLQGAYLILILSCALLTYIWGVYFWGARNPFGFSYAFERFISRFKRDGTKIVDLSTGTKRASDDEFVDRMLDKISRSGEESLSWSERRRMEAISRQKASRK